MVELRFFLPVVLVFGVSVMLQGSSATDAGKSTRRGYLYKQFDVPHQYCNKFSNTTCAQCLNNVTCLWCQTTQKCSYYPVRTILPPYSLCPLSEARWGACWVNFQTLIITICVVGGIIIIAIFICCFCCCKCENIWTTWTENKMERQAEKRKVRQEERKAEMKMRHDEIRQKYGLKKTNPYNRFENS